MHFYNAVARSLTFLRSFIFIMKAVTFIVSSLQGSFDSDTDTAESDDDYMDYDSDRYIKVRLSLIG